MPRPTTASSAITGISTSRAERHDPSTTATPTTSGATAPTPAAAALASVIAAGPPSPCTAESTVALQVTTNEPPNEHRKAPSRVAGSAVNAVRVTRPTHRIVRPAQISGTRPKRTASRATISALHSAPVASAVPCRPATVRLKPCSSRSRVSDGPNP